MRLLPWDTEFFGIRVGRADLAEEPLDHAVGAARDAGVECLYLYAPGDRLELVAAAVRRGALPVDLHSVLECGPVEAGLEPPRDTRLAGEGDDETLVELAARLAPASRFAADPRFDPARIAEMYRLWLRRCLREGVVTVPAGATNGFVAGRPDGGHFQIELMFVDPEARGAGLARTLTLALLAAAPPLPIATTVRATNFPTQRHFQSLGLRTSWLTVILHLWLDKAQ